MVLKNRLFRRHTYIDQILSVYRMLPGLLLATQIRWDQNIKRKFGTSNWTNSANLTPDIKVQLYSKFIKKTVFLSKSCKKLSNYNEWKLLAKNFFFVFFLVISKNSKSHVLIVVPKCFYVENRKRLTPKPSEPLVKLEKYHLLTGISSGFFQYCKWHRLHVKI